MGFENEFKNVTLSSIANGGVEELFQAAIQEILQNIQNINTPPDAKRCIDIKIVFKPNEERTTIQVGVSVAPKLASIRGTGTVIYTGDRKVGGRFQAVETNLKQMRISDAPDLKLVDSKPEAPATP